MPVIAAGDVRRVARVAKPFRVPEGALIPKMPFSVLPERGFPVRAAEVARTLNVVGTPCGREVNGVIPPS